MTKFIFNNNRKNGLNDLKVEVWIKEFKLHAATL